MKLTIGKKIFSGYLPILILIFAITLFTLLQLNKVKRINREIIEKDLVVNNAADNMIEVLLAQESFGQRYIILKSQDILSLFWKRDQEFKTYYEDIIAFSAEEQFSKLIPLEEHHSDYNKFFQSCIKHLDSTTTFSYTYADSLRKSSFDVQISILNGLLAESRKNQMDKTHATAELGRFAFRTLTIVSILGVVLAIVIAFFITNSILSSIRSLKVAAGLVAVGKFKSLPVVKSKDELGDLSIAFNEMAHRLIKLEEMYMDSSPLTRLPGGIAIENWVKKKIDRGEPFAFCMFDLDNFKPFNDRYGYSRGNSVIKNTAKIIKDCTKELGNKSDFTGHIGGDDFALITTPDKYKDICEKVIKEFDKQIVDYYNPEDKEKGCIHSKNRKGEKLIFPIMTISISVLNSEKSYVENYIEVGEIIAELKKYAKSFPKSSLVVDRRGGKKRSKKNEKKKGD